jgi:hypothetical protein
MRVPGSDGGSGSCGVQIVAESLATWVVAAAVSELLEAFDVISDVALSDAVDTGDADSDVLLQLDSATTNGISRATHR